MEFQVYYVQKAFFFKRNNCEDDLSGEGNCRRFRMSVDKLIGI